ncbi:hypothetical protein F5Y02DRAFT_370160 [Annulohypoxylon stygium]|nr:hypothetical protein F5Y02DRAFT_370160 [Annulohypoxylon stygium]
MTLAGDASREMFDIGGWTQCEPEPEVAGDSDMMDYDYINVSELIDLDLPLILDRENQQNDGLFATSDNPAPDLNLEGLNYREACEPSLGRPFDELSFPEIFDHDLSTNCKFCDDQFCPLYDDSSLVDVSFTNYDRFVVRDLDILSEASCSPPDIQLEDWFKRDNPRITTEPQQYASGHRNKVDDCDIGRGHINSINRGKYQPTTAKVERQVTPYAKLLEGSRLERNSRVDHRQSVANARP